MTVHRGSRKGETYAKLKPKTRAKLERLGRERMLIYKTLALTGLRKSELDSVTVGQLHLDADRPYVKLNAADEKNREGNSQPLPAELVVNLRSWLADKLEFLQDEARHQGRTIPIQLPSSTPLFTMPDKLSRVFDRDLKFAGIAKVDDLSRRVDVHALRHTYGTLLSQKGVPPRIVQALMRHSKLELTMGVYTDVRLLDVAGAIDKLPSLPLPSPETQSAPASSTGTDGNLQTSLVPKLGPATSNPCPPESLPGIIANLKPQCTADTSPAVSPCPDTKKASLTGFVNEAQSVGDTRLELVTPSLSIRLRTAAVLTRNPWCTSG